MRRNRVLITGHGVACPLGCDPASVFEGLSEGRSGIGQLTWAAGFGCRSRVGGAVADRELDLALSPLGLTVGGLLRHEALALAAAGQAVREAGFVPEALVLTTATAGFQAAEELYAGHREKLPREAFYFDNLATVVAKRLGVAARKVVSISTGCTSGVDGLGYAIWAVREGRWKSVLVVAAEAALTPSTLAAFNTLGAVTVSHNDDPRSASRPFSKDRDGFVLAEGAGALVLEREDVAERRGTKGVVAVAGFGSVNSGFHMTSIETDGRAIARSIRAALDDCDDPAAAVDGIAYGNLHGSGTRQNDAAEAAAMRIVFGPRAGSIPVNSTKALVGHSLGAAGMVEAVHTVLSMRNATVTPAVNAVVPDPAIGLFLPTEVLRPYRIPFALKTASGFSGIHSAVVFESCERG